MRTLRQHWELVAAALVAAALVLPRLGSPASFVFDEAYYVPDATDLLAGHVEPAGAHPPLGKWLIAEAVRLGGLNPWAWRLPAALSAIGVVALTVVLARRLTRSRALLALPLLLLADPAFYTTARLALLDMPLACAILGAVYLGVLALERGGASLAPWVAAYAVAGAAAAIKWTGLAAVVAVLLLHTRAWADAQERAAPRRGPGWLAVPLAAALAAYAACWAPWALDAARADPETCRTADCPGGVRGLARVGEHQLDVLRFQERLRPRNANAASPVTWLTGGHPMLLYEVTCRPGDAGLPASCDGRAGETLRLESSTNPALWCGGLAALVLSAAGLAGARPPRSTLVGIVVLMPLLTLVPWLLTGRKVYAFYSVAAVPFLVLAAVNVLDGLPRRRRLAAAAAFAAAVVAFALPHLGTMAVPV